MFDDRPGKTFPDAELVPAKGFKVVMALSIGMVAPAGTPKEIVDGLSSAIKAGTEGAEFQKKSDELSFDLHYIDSAQFDIVWTDMEKEVATILKKGRGQVRER